MVKEGKVLSINISSNKGTVKRPIYIANFVKNLGIEGDAHAEKDSSRQISILSIFSAKKMENENYFFRYGDFGENLTVDIPDIYKFPVKSRIYFRNGVILEISQIGKQCHSECTIYKIAGNCIMPSEGVFAIVLKGGKVSTGENFKIEFDES